jgi:Heterokaryon incompatibility protein (HET)
MELSAGNTCTSFQEQQHESRTRKRVLCAKCQFIFDNWDARDNWKSEIGEHEHHSITTLQESARKGCPICEIFILSLNDYAIERIGSSARHQTSVVEVRRGPDRNNIYDVKLDNSSIWEETGPPWIEVVVAGNEKYLREGRFPDYTIDHGTDDQIGKIAPYTDSAATWDLVRKWFRTCLESHPDCSVRLVERVLPTRLVQVDSTDLDICLVLSTDLQPDTQYLTLSHCWGKKVFTTLTRDRLPGFLTRIPVEGLSKTFREAMLVTRRLSFNYIWIDSLCIIQDDLSDWQRESVAMRTVYANASMSIAAADAPDGDTGCFFPREPGKVHGWKVKLREEEGKTPTKGSLYCFPDQYLLKLFDKSILQTRAWVFQERLLAPRLLHLGAAEIAWECRSLCASETFPSGIINGIMTIPGVGVHWSKGGDVGNLVNEWAPIINHYSAGKVTFQRDKLIALSGISRLFSARYNTQYLAGLWKEDLVQQLVWHTLENPQPRPEYYQAPTWSWASINLTASLPSKIKDDKRYPLTPLITIEEAATVPIDDPFGGISDGHLRITCTGWGVGRLSPKRDGRRIHDIYLRTSKTRHECIVYPDVEMKDPSHRLVFLPVLRVGLKPDESGNEELCGLILEEARPDNHRYARVGMFEISGAGVIAKCLRAVATEFNGQRDRDLGQLVETDGEGRTLYAITIV